MPFLHRRQHAPRRPADYNCMCMALAPGTRPDPGSPPAHHHARPTSAPPKPLVAAQSTHWRYATSTTMAATTTTLPALRCHPRPCRCHVAGPTLARLSGPRRRRLSGPESQASTGARLQPGPDKDTHTRSAATFWHEQLPTTTDRPTATRQACSCPEPSRVPDISSHYLLTL